ncbi:hypothetical protein BDR03DRAFT_988435, partial [Suillus americanus]
SMISFGCVFPIHEMASFPITGTTCRMTPMALDANWTGQVKIEVPSSSDAPSEGAVASDFGWVRLLCYSNVMLRWFIVEVYYGAAAIHAWQLGTLQGILRDCYSQLRAVERASYPIMTSLYAKWAQYLKRTIFQKRIFLITFHYSVLGQSRPVRTGSMQLRADALLSANFVSALVIGVMAVTRLFFIVVVVVVPSVYAHIAFWHPSMWGFNVTDKDPAYSYDNRP